MIGYSEIYTAYWTKFKKVINQLLEKKREYETRGQRDADQLVSANHTETIIVTKQRRTSSPLSFEQKLHLIIHPSYITIQIKTYKYQQLIFSYNANYMMSLVK